MTHMTMNRKKKRSIKIKSMPTAPPGPTGGSIRFDSGMLGANIGIPANIKPIISMVRLGFTFLPLPSFKPIAVAITSSS